MALEVTLLKTPYEISFSGNPMPFLFALSPYGAAERSQDIRLQVSVMVDVGDGSGVFGTVYQQNFYPDGNGQFLFDVKTIVDPYLEFYTPKPGLKNPVPASKQCRQYKLAYLLQLDGAPVDVTVVTDVFYCLKGGLAYEQWHWKEFFTDRVTASGMPLHFIAEGEKVSLDQPLYLFWIYPYNDNAFQQVAFIFKLDDGSTVSYNMPRLIRVDKWGVCCAPIGFNQIDTGTIIPAGRIIVSYRVLVVASSNHIVELFTLTVDQRKFYDTYTILYRNSLGGIDSVRLRGQVDFEADYNYQNATRTLQPFYFSNLNLLPQSVQEQTSESAKFTGDTGFMSKAAVNKLRDMFMSPQLLELYNGKFLPIVASNKTVKFYANRDSLISVQLQWQRAFLNQFYTPGGYMPGTRSCPAVDNIVVKQVNKNTLLIMYSLEEPYDQIEVQIQNGNTADDITVVYNGNSGSVLQTFVNPSTGGPVGISIGARTVCNSDTVPMEYGPFKWLNPTVTGNSNPVANDDTFTLAAGYNTAVLLEGSVLTNDYDPDGDSISVVVASGSTTAGGSYSIDAAGKITYTPPSSSYNGIDSFVYTITDGTATATALAKIKVGNSSAVYVRCGFLNTYVPSLPDATLVTGEVWLFFFSDAAGANPLDVSSLNLEVKVKKQTHTQTEFGVVSDTYATTTYNVFGTRYRIYTGDIYKSQKQFTWSYPRILGYSWVVQPNAGYQPI